MKKPNKAYIDGDILVYKTAFYTEAEGSHLIQSKFDRDLKYWIPEGVTDYEIAISCKRHDNFRSKEYPLYKSNRNKTHRPDTLGEVYDYVTENYKVKTLPSLEADDILGIYASKGKGIAVTIDKDLMGVYGWHFNPNKEEPVKFISKKEAEDFFLIQWLEIVLIVFPDYGE